ncbi:MAG TPA: hypothetical protein VIN07_14340 [Flavipsychrobacter sp.]
MRRTVSILMLLTGALFALNAAAGEDDKDQKKKPKIVPIPVYFGNSGIDSGVVSEEVFDSLLKQGFTSRDSNGRVYNVNSFMFTYCERNLYEDSVGNPIILTDYLSEFCMNGKLEDYQLEALRYKSKWGDTLIIEKIMLTSADSAKTKGYGKAMKLVIGR